MSDHEVLRAVSQGSSQQAGMAGIRQKLAVHPHSSVPIGGGGDMGSLPRIREQLRTEVFPHLQVALKSHSRTPGAPGMQLLPVLGPWPRSHTSAGAAHPGLCLGAWAWEEEHMAPGPYRSLGIVS